METGKVHLTREKETLLVTLYGRALDSRGKDPILNDRFADGIVRKIDYDFKKLKPSRNDRIIVPIRAKYIDRWTREFLAANPACSVLHLGCGLDSRVFRIDPSDTVRWYDVDYPEVVELRRQLYPERHDYRIIGSSVTDPRWLEGIPADRPVLMVTEGLVQYLPEKEGITLFARITERFPHGEFVFDAFSRPATRLIKFHAGIRKTGASMGWGIDDALELERSVPGLRFVSEVPFTNLPEFERFSRVMEVSLRSMDRIAVLRRMVRLLRYRF